MKTLAIIAVINLVVFQIVIQFLAHSAKGSMALDMFVAVWGIVTSLLAILAAILLLIYDTETTGIIRGDDYTNPANPYPDGWAMPVEAGAVNGLTTEYLNEVGLPVDVAMRAAIAIAMRADLCVAHNVDFDTKIMAAALWRQLIADGESEEDAHGFIQGWLSKPTYCTMKESKPIVKALTTNGRLKYPKLSEAYRHFFDREIDNAHSANADAVAVLEIYLALQREAGK